ncbi:fibro-slime domain-containing protein [Sellimonas catena]|uniref:PA14 domain-containing protein n=1 Tax=Sellimonas catena TaxID=2994035 RepID=A0A9W6CHI6_9FIRM|nr:fibro-slime domain-containing protein [Sellimonas catena]GLG90073.1 hypothetical protein Selli2_15000 [Sellimonas catena]
MKSKRRKRVIASVLCMVLMLSTGMSTLAEADAGTVPAVEETTAAQTTAQETKSTSTDAQTAETETQTQTETENQTETKQTEEAAQTKQEETTAVQPTEEASGGETTQTETDQTAQNTQDQTTSAETSGTETQNETVETQTEETETTTKKEETQETKEEAKVSPAFSETYENSEVTVKVTAEEGIVPEGAKLSVTPIVKKEITDQMSEEEKAEAKKINDQYDLTEKKLSEDSDKNKETMEGFLAYDISFLVDGKEVEPSGDVKVVIDFKKAAVPEGVSEDSKVSIKHMKEDVNAENGIVVEDMGEKADVQTTEKTEVKKVEFTAESFSVFTITWKEDRHEGSLTIMVVDSNGKSIGNERVAFDEKDFNWRDEKAVTVDAILDKVIQKMESGECSKETFNKAVYGENGEFSFFAPEINGFKYKSTDSTYEFRYQPVDNEKSWNPISSEDVIYFIFGEDPELSFTPIDTESTKDTIDINLFDYQVGSDGDESADWENSEGINRDHVLKFVDDKGENHQTVNINQDGSSGKINSGMVENKLVDGYPKLSTEKTEKAELLDYLFDLSEKNNVKKVYSGLDKLFTIDQEGYHVFNSDQHYAYLKNNGSSFAKEFTVGNIAGQNSPGFYPFSQPTSSTIADIKESSDAATLGYTGVNHYYGMTIATSFIQPKGGKINNNQDMIFEFSGDDDVWVFIDDVLVLDLGGIHGKVSGTINFANGEVTRTDIKGSKASGTTLKEAFDKAGVNVELESTGGFADYSTHTIKFFYLERGNFDSNCMIKFNFPTIPKDSVAVAKEVTDEDGNGIDYADDIDFKFNIKVDGSNYANKEYALWKNGEEVVDEYGQPVTGTTDSDGNFTLKHSEMAVFSGISADSQYQVTELGAYLNGYTVYIDGTVHEVNPDSTSGITVPSVQTDMLTVGEDQSVVFRNEIKNRATLNIKKQLATGEEATNKEFQIKLKIQGVEYEGTYSVGAQSGFEANDGIIALKAGQTATITGLPYGVSFEVEEMLDGVYQPTYGIDGSVTDIVIPSNGDEDNTVTTASAQMIGESANVTVTNSKLEKGAGTTDVAVDKTWDNSQGNYELPKYVTVTLYEDVNRDGQWDINDKLVSDVSPIQLNALNGWHGKWENLSGDTDFVVKEEYPEGYKLKITESVNDITNVVYIDRIETCRNLKWDLQKNNMLVTKKGSDWVIWTLHDLDLSDDEKKEVIDWIQEKVNGNMQFDNTEFAFGEGGFGENSNINLVDIGDGDWQLQFGHSSTWSMFWYFKYDRTQKITLTNKIIPDYKTSLNVTKVWSDNNPSGLTVEIQLLQNDKPYIVNGSEVKITLLGENNSWSYTFEDLPYFSSVDGGWIVNEYTVKETKIGDSEVVDNYANGYISSVSGSMENGYVITNEKTTPWQIIKVSSSDQDITLEGAKFTLKTSEADDANPETDVTYWGKSDGSGIVKWFSDDQFTEGNEIDFIPDGTYVLTEIGAPDGYSVNKTNWTITIQSGNVTISGETPTKIGNVLTFYYKNTPLYELPSAGGPGIYWYTIGGMLLMIAGTLVLYKNKRREVLKR